MGITIQMVTKTTPPFAEPSSVLVIATIKTGIHQDGKDSKKHSIINLGEADQCYWFGNCHYTCKEIVYPRCITFKEFLCLFYSTTNKFSIANKYHSYSHAQHLRNSILLGPSPNQEWRNCIDSARVNTARIIVEHVESVICKEFEHWEPGFTMEIFKQINDLNLLNYNRCNSTDRFIPLDKISEHLYNLDAIKYKYGGKAGANIYNRLDSWRHGFYGLLNGDRLSVAIKIAPEGCISPIEFRLNFELCDPCLPYRDCYCTETHSMIKNPNNIVKSPVVNAQLAAFSHNHYKSHWWPNHDPTPFINITVENNPTIYNANLLEQVADALAAAAAAADAEGGDAEGGDAEGGDAEGGDATNNRATQGSETVSGNNN